MSSVSIKNVVKTFGQTTVLHSVNIEIKEGEFFFLLGPSGCGKTTLLRVITGLEVPDNGEVFFNDKNMTRVPAQKRNTSMVFQNYALWPHLTVRENVAYGLENRKLSKKDILEEVDAILSLVKMTKYDSRLPNQLSGGQQQRIALARALVVNPSVLLLDEPLSNLDARLRAEMRIELLRLHQETGITTIYVTHDQDEALALADRIAFLDNGHVMQIGSPRDLYANPTNIKTARFLGKANVMECKGPEKSHMHYSCETPFGKLHGRMDNAPSGKSFCFFRPEALKLAEADSSENFITGIVKAAMFLGDREHLYLENNGVLYEAIIPAPSVPTEVGRTLQFTLCKNDVLFLGE